MFWLNGQVDRQVLALEEDEEGLLQSSFSKRLPHRLPLLERKQRRSYTDKIRVKSSSLKKKKEREWDDEDERIDSFENMDDEELEFLDQKLSDVQEAWNKKMVFLIQDEFDEGPETYLEYIEIKKQCSLDKVKAYKAFQENFFQKKRRDNNSFDEEINRNCAARLNSLFGRDHYLRYRDALGLYNQELNDDLRETTTGSLMIEY